MKMNLLSLSLCAACLLAMAGCKPSEATASISSVSEEPSQVEETSGYPNQVITITSFDGVQFDGKLRLPESGTADRVVIYVNSSGPHTYDDRRSGGDIEFNYHDLFAEQLAANGVAYFSYNTRGVTPGDTPPLYVTIDEDAYQQYKPGNQVKDIECIITHLQEIDALKEAEIYLLGWSEGTAIAPLVAKGNHVRVDAILLAGYMNSTMTETIEWQLTGHSSMVNYCRYYDYNQDGVVTASTKGRLDELEERKSLLETSILNEEMTKSRLTREQIIFWLYRFRKLNTKEEKQRERLIDGFVNSVYVFDDRLVIAVNFKEDAETVSLDLLNSLGDDIIEDAMMNPSLIPLGDALGFVVCWGDAA